MAGARREINTKAIRDAISSALPAPASSDVYRRERDTLAHAVARLTRALDIDPTTKGAIELAVERIQSLRNTEPMPLWSRTRADLSWRPQPGDHVIVADTVRLWRGQRGTVRTVDGPLVFLELDTTGLIRVHHHHLRKG